MTKVICIDPGHGGWDPGAIAIDGLPEKEFNLQLALAVRDGLTDGYDCKVVLTRDTDAALANPGELGPELYARAHVANRANADLLVSLHHDNIGNRSTRGGSLWVWTDKRAPSGGLVWLTAEGNHTAPVSYRMAKVVAPAVEAALATHGVPFNGIKCADFGVLRHSNRAAVLLEAFFGSSPADVAAARSPGFIPDLAQAIAKGVAAALELPEKAPAQPAQADPPPQVVSAPVLLDGVEIGAGVIIDGRAYLPVRAAGEALGLHVHWNGKQVLLSRKQ